MLAHEPAHHPHPAIRWRPQGIRQAHGIHANHYRLSVLIRSAAEAKLREADRLECEAWNAIMWAGGPAMPSPGESQAEPTIAKAIKRWIRPTGSQVRPVRLGLAGPAAITEATAGNPIWKLEAALYCEPCSEGRHYSRRQRAHILGLTYPGPIRSSRGARPQGEPETMTKLMPDRARSPQKRPQTSLRPLSDLSVV